MSLVSVPNRCPRKIPPTVENSAATFIDADITLPLLATIPTPATREVITDDGNPYRKRLNIMGIPVKSNFKLGYHGNGILRPEYFSV
jgi:hypothetical protein